MRNEGEGGPIVDGCITCKFALWVCKLFPRQYAFLKQCMTTLSAIQAVNVVVLNLFTRIQAVKKREKVALVLKENFLLVLAYQLHFIVYSPTALNAASFDK